MLAQSACKICISVLSNAHTRLSKRFPNEDRIFQFPEFANQVLDQSEAAAFIQQYRRLILLYHPTVDRFNEWRASLPSDTRASESQAMLAKLCTCPDITRDDNAWCDLIGLFWREDSMDGLKHVLSLLNSFSDPARLAYLISLFKSICKSDNSEDPETEKREEEVKERTGRTEVVKKRDETEMRKESEQNDAKTGEMVVSSQQPISCVGHSAHACHLLVEGKLSQLSQLILNAAAKLSVEVDDELISELESRDFQPRCDQSASCGRTAREMVAVLRARSARRRGAELCFRASVLPRKVDDCRKFIASVADARPYYERYSNEQVCYYVVYS